MEEVVKSRSLGDRIFPLPQHESCFGWRVGRLQRPVKMNALERCQACDDFSCAGHSSNALGECQIRIVARRTEEGKAFHVSDTGGFQFWLFSASAKFKSRYLPRAARVEAGCARHLAPCPALSNCSVKAPL